MYELNQNCWEQGLSRGIFKLPNEPLMNKQYWNFVQHFILQSNKASEIYFRNLQVSIPLVSVHSS